MDVAGRRWLVAQPGGLTLGWMNRVSSIKDGRVELRDGTFSQMQTKTDVGLSFGGRTSAFVVGLPDCDFANLA